MFDKVGLTQLTCTRTTSPALARERLGWWLEVSGGSNGAGAEAIKLCLACGLAVGTDQQVV